MRRYGLGVLGTAALFVSQILQACGGDSASEPGPLADSGTADASNAGSDGGDPTSDAAPSAITVSGRLLSVGDAPLASHLVLIGNATPVTADAEGRFTVPGVAVPYDVTIILSETKNVIRYEGLTRPDPILRPDLFLQTKDGMLTGTLTGISYPPQPSTSTLVQFAPPGSRGGVRTVTPSSAFSVLGVWGIDPSSTGSLHAIQFTHDGNGKPISYVSHGSIASVTVSDGGNVAVGAIAMGATPGQATLTANVSVPAGYTLTERQPSLALDGRVIFDFPIETSSNPSVTYPLPQIPNAKATLSVTAKDVNGASATTVKRNLEPGATNVPIGLLPAPTVTLPVTGATGVSTQTSFSWSRFDGGIHLAMLSPTTEGMPTYAIFTSATTVTIPDLSAAGLSLPPAITYGWGVYGLAPVASMDAFAADNLFSASKPDFYQTQTAARTFTTAP